MHSLLGVSVVTGRTPSRAALVPDTSPKFRGLPAGLACGTPDQPEGSRGHSPARETDDLGRPSSRPRTAQITRTRLLLLRRRDGYDHRGVIPRERRSRVGVIVFAVVIRRVSRHRVLYRRVTTGDPSHKRTAV